jgi:excinuclease UvrABC nuclease subunit
VTSYKKIDEAYDNIFFFVETLRHEVHAFAVTHTDHDRQRALNAVGIMEKYVADLKRLLEEGSYGRNE